MITFSGNNLKIAISSAPTEHGDWLSFSTWYSCRTYLPDADVFLVVPKKRATHAYYHHWSRRANIQKFRTIPDYDPLLVLDHESMIVRQPEKEIMELNNCGNFVTKGGFFKTAREKNTMPHLIGETGSGAPIIWHGGKVGKFELEKWEHGTPFDVVKSLHSPDISIDEGKILQMWFKMQPLYLMMSDIKNYELAPSLI